ncbi:hypothetical protein AMECASPLE_037420, partial [Ameca splendens]
ISMKRPSEVSHYNLMPGKCIQILFYTLSQTSIYCTMILCNGTTKHKSKYGSVGRVDILQSECCGFISSFLLLICVSVNECECRLGKCGSSVKYFE